jgi:hypothetical protein
MKNTPNLSTIPRLLPPLVGAMLLLLAVILSLPAPSKADGPDDATVVIEFGENNPTVRSISFTAPISGLAALHLTGLDIVTADFGGGFIAVCRIEGVGCPATDCFTCDPAGRSWGNSFWTGSAWQGHSAGAAATTLTEGAIEGWAYGAYEPPDYDTPAPSLPAPLFTATAKALTWLADQQSPTTGGYGSAGNSVEMLLALGANGYRGADWRAQADAPALFGHVLATAAAYSTDGVAAAGKLAIGLSAAGDCYPAAAARPETAYVAATGVYSGGYGTGGAGPQSWAMLGTHALSQTIPDLAVSYLKNIANPDGGWGWASGNSDTNGTALAIQALRAAGEPPTATAIVKGLDYLADTQNPDGGFPYAPGYASDANSTAYVVQALLAAGQEPLTGAWVISGANPIAYLLDRQLSDGSLEWQSGSGSSQLATQQAIPALLGRPFPLSLTPNLATCPLNFLPLVVND